MFRLSRLESNRNPARTILHGLLRGLKIDLAVAQGSGPREGSSISNVDLVAVVVDVEHIKGFFGEGQGRTLRDLYIYIYICFSFGFRPQLGLYVGFRPRLCLSLSLF